MKSVEILEVKKEDFKDLEKYLKKNNLLDDRGIWFAGYDDRMNGQNNAIAANLFYGNRRMIVISIKDEVIYYLQNSKKGFNVNELGNINEKYKISIRRNLVHPSIEINTPDAEFIKILVNKNKKVVFEFKKLVK